jgi:hypothetical protein
MLTLAYLDRSIGRLRKKKGGQNKKTLAYLDRSIGRLRKKKGG